VDLIHVCIRRPVGVSVGVLLVVLFGLLALFSIPVQLTPNVDVPKVTIRTTWLGASPQEVEREVIDRQEEQLRSVAGLREMRSTSRDNGGDIELEFFPDVNKDTALRDVTDKLRQVRGYPLQVEEPSVAAADTARDSEIAWLILFTQDGGDDTRVVDLRDFAEDHIKPWLDRVPGVGSTDIYGGREREVQVLVDAGQLAARGLTFAQLETALRQQNANLSAGTLAQGKRDYTLRTVGQYESLDEILDTVIAYTPGGPVYVRDVAEVVSTFKKQRGFVRSKGQFVLAFPVRREVGANVIEVMDGLRAAVR
jgi:HAE1 family hydrophobic/amphiphilic exporter-1